VLDVAQEPRGGVGEGRAVGVVVVGPQSDLAALVGQQVGERVLRLAAGQVPGGRLATTDVRGRESPQRVLGVTAGDAGSRVPDRSLAAVDQLQVAGDALTMRAEPGWGSRRRGLVVSC
jgi:hypothetical protein